MLFRTIPGTPRVTVVPLTSSEPTSGSIVIIKPAAPTLFIVSATLTMLAESNSKSKVYVQIISFPRTRDGIKASGVWQLSRRPMLELCRLTSAAAAMGKRAFPGVGAVIYTSYSDIKKIVKEMKHSS